ncbi:MAG: hypothetical protein QNJ97_02775 [Myxococcota bacterium]|nr:hypothetical protein [Myxococcota bacterium]
MYRTDVDSYRQPDIDLKVVTAEGWKNPDRPIDAPCGCRVTDDHRVTLYEDRYFRGSLREENGVIAGKFTVAKEIKASYVGVLQAALAYALSRRGDLLLHASGVQRHGRTWLFSGLSGSGKTTIATELSGGGRAFCVDRAIVSQTSERAFLAYPTPISDSDNAVAPVSGARVDGILFIHQADTCSLEPLSASEAARHILRNVLSPLRRPSWDTMMLQTVEAIAGSGLCYQLGFLKDESFWPLIDSLVS